MAVCECAQLCLTLYNLMDCSPPGSSVHGIFQARALEWGAIEWTIIISCDQIEATERWKDCATCPLKTLYLYGEITK